MYKSSTGCGGVETSGNKLSGGDAQGGVIPKDIHW